MKKLTEKPQRRGVSTGTVKFEDAAEMSARTETVEIPGKCHLSINEDVIAM